MKIDYFTDGSGLLFPVEWTRAALVLALMSAWVVIALFVYLNRHTRKPYFYLWTVGWIFYSVHLAAAIELAESPDLPFLVMARRACIGIGALFMFWGSFQLMYVPRNMRELKLASVMIVVWSAVAAYWIRERLWITAPVFVLLGSAGVYTGLIYWWRRKRYHGAKILGTGFLLWGLNLIAFPVLDLSPTTRAISYVASAVLSVMIAIGMVVEEQVTSAEESFRAMFDANKDAVFLLDLWSLKIADANRRALELTQRSLVELIGSGFTVICPSLCKDGSLNTANNEQLLKTMCKPFVEFPILRANGEQVLCEGEVTAVEWQRQRLLQVNVRDTSERGAAGPQLHHTEKLSALGVLVASVANRLNNHLGVVTAYVQLLTLQQTADEKTRQRVERIAKEIKQAASNVRDLLAFAQPNAPQRMSCDINQLITQVIETRATDFRMAEIQVEMKLDTSLQRAGVDASQIEQVFENLLNNAAEAMMGRTEKRLLTISTRDCGNAIRILVADSGKGIASKDVKEIFDPFFSTKLQGKGAGLGLTVSNSIMQAHGGRILVESTPGKGSTFIIELPLMPCKLEPATPLVPTGRIAPSPVAGRRLLVVDDEPGMIQVLTEVLTAEGYIVDSALGGTDGMKHVFSAAYDVMIVDLNMPDMDGKTFYEMLRMAKPDMARRIIFMSGDTVSPNARSFLTSTGNRWIAKPFAIKTILQVVEESLGQETESTAKRS